MARLTTLQLESWDSRLAYDSHRNGSVARGSRMAYTKRLGSTEMTHEARWRNTTRTNTTWTCGSQKENFHSLHPSLSSTMMSGGAVRVEATTDDGFDGREGSDRWCVGETHRGRQGSFDGSMQHASTRLERNKWLCFVTVTLRLCDCDRDSLTGVLHSMMAGGAGRQLL